jgi:hypothetical protein
VAQDVEWNFDTPSTKKPAEKPAEKPREPEKSLSRKDEKTDSKRPPSTRDDKSDKSRDKKEKTESRSGSTSSATSPAAPAVQNSTAGGGSGGAQNGARPSALTSVIYPVLSKLLKQHQDEATVAALAQLKIAFDNAEKAQPGITHSLIAQIIETLKRYLIAAANVSSDMVCFVCVCVRGIPRISSHLLQMNIVVLVYDRLIFLFLPLG